MYSYNMDSANYRQNSKARHFGEQTNRQRQTDIGLRKRTYNTMYDNQMKYLPTIISKLKITTKSRAGRRAQNSPDR